MKSGGSVPGACALAPALSPIIDTNRITTWVRCSLQLWLSCLHRIHHRMAIPGARAPASRHGHPTYRRGVAIDTMKQLEASY